MFILIHGYTTAKKISLSPASKIISAVHNESDDALVVSTHLMVPIASPLPNATTPSQIPWHWSAFVTPIVSLSGLLLLWIINTDILSEDYEPKISITGIEENVAVKRFFLFLSFVLLFVGAVCGGIVMWVITRKTTDIFPGLAPFLSNLFIVSAAFLFEFGCMRFHKNDEESFC